jgi:hypothetical protein
MGPGDAGPLAIILLGMNQQTDTDRPVHGTGGPDQNYLSPQGDRNEQEHYYRENAP